MSKTINLFVSHKGEDESRIEDFKKLMGQKGYNFRDSSIKESEPNRANDEEYIKSKYLRPAIDWAGTIVVLIGQNTHKSDWVNWEIDYALKKGKKIIGVFIPGEKDATIPDLLQDYADSIVGWNSEKIDEAIRNDNTYWEDEGGNSLPSNSPYRYTC